jgi:hypothetical protein
MRMDDNIVFNANASDAGQVNARFNGNHVSWNQDYLLTASHPGLFVHFQPKSMPGAMHKILVEPVTRQNPPGGGIHSFTTDAGLRGGYCCRLRIVNRLIATPDARRSAPNEDGPGNIAAIVGEYNTQVEDDQFIFPESFLGGPRVGVGGTRTEGHDGFKCRPGGPEVAHMVVNLGGNLDFAHAGFQQFDGVGKDLAA